MTKEDFEILINKNGSENLGWKTNRLKFDPNDKENAFSQHWKEENRKNRGMNYGRGILQDLFFEKSDSMHTPKCFLKITNRDRLVTATVIQWLGTNVGFCWLREALKKAGYEVKKIKKDE